MKKLALSILVAFLGVGYSAWGSAGTATLPTHYSGESGNSWAATAMPVGWTQTGLGSYAASYDANGFAAKIDTTGDFLQIHYSGAAGAISYYIKGNSISGAYVFKIQESSNGTTWTDVKSYAGSGITGSAVLTSNTISASSSYVRFFYATKAVGNVGIDGVTLSPSAGAAITFTPAGNQSIAVSNTLNLAVGLPGGYSVSTKTVNPTPSGTWSMPTTNFTFTPAAADSGKTFTFRVIATKSGAASITGSVQIAATPYVPPVPVITFVGKPYGVMAGNTLTFSCTLTPAGSGITGHSISPTPSGAFNRTGNSFTFNSARTDGPRTYTVTVTATNSFGTSSNSAVITVSEYIVPGAYILDFENASKTSYAPGDITEDGRTWELDGALIGDDAADLKEGNKSARIQYGNQNAVNNAILCKTPFSTGIGTFSCRYGPYGTHGDTAPDLIVEIAESVNGPWFAMGTFSAGAVSTLTSGSLDINIQGAAIYLRIRSEGTVGRSANIDNITIVPYSGSSRTSFENYLIGYNITPGDPGCASENYWADGETANSYTTDDFDGDGFANWAEFNANPKTNPYDKNSHP